MNDYRLTFPVTALVSGMDGIATLRAELQSDTANRVDALGDPRDASGNIVYPDPNADPNTPPPDVWYGRPGSAATSYTDLNGNTVQVPAKGDPTLYYCHIRSAQDIAFEPTQHDMRDADPKASADVLGIWLGDAPP
jgi:hypothetical protein